MAQTKLRSVTRTKPCDVCSGNHKCSRGDDGLIMCGRPPESAPSGFIDLGQAKGDAQFRMYRSVDDPIVLGRNREREEQRGRNHYPHTSRANGNGNGHKEPRPDLGARAAQLAAAITDADRTELATELRLPPSAITLLPIGFSATGFHRDYQDKPCWTFPETDASGRVIGITCRYADGNKKAMPGGSRGLCQPTGWREREGPIFLVEGPSDTLAGSALGVATIGRPSNKAGIEQLAELLRDVPKERPIIVVGEYDPNEKGQWPGRDGAVETAAKLTDLLGRPVSWILPPDGAKDVRAWTRTLDPANPEQWKTAGQEFVRHAASHAQKPPATTPTGSFAWSPLDSEVFADTDYRPTWLVKRLLVKNQQCFVGGPKKSLKTSLVLDLAVSLAGGTPFLGEFNVYKPVRVAILSGESGGFTLQETARRICQAKGIDLRDLGDMLLWQFTLPQLANVTHMAALRSGLSDAGVEVVIIDPLYLCLLAGVAAGSVKAENLFDMGPLLQAVTLACLDAGATPILLHHSKKGAGGSKDPLDLDDLSFSGIAEFARQWLLVSRREPYKPGTGLHNLWVSAGGSVGHGGLWAVDVNEGVIDEEFDGRRWELEVKPFGEFKQDKTDEKTKAKEEKTRKQDNDDDTALMTALDKLDPGRAGVGCERVRKESRVPEGGGGRFTRALDRMIAARLVEKLIVEVETANEAKRKATGIRRRSGE